MDELISRTEACELLNVEMRTMFHYLNKGYLKKIERGRRTYLSKNDVLLFKKALEDPLINPDKLLLTKIYLQVQQQQLDIDTVKKLLDLYHEPLNLEDFSILALYNAATALDIQSWDENWEQDWLELLIRFREEDFFQLEKVTKDPHPWKPFYKLILVTQDILDKRGDKELVEKYTSVRERFKKLILIWCEIKNSPRALVTLPAKEFGKHFIARLIKKYSKK